ncbi:unnamed protein product [Rotaria socialis]|uniref:Uncharacterized protein n=1 Tax=Rotaria socialis TaxID=392032 RepID=A0A817U880_9BILA|nr:unnamed protein product [Rotaria socialis]
MTSSLFNIVLLLIIKDFDNLLTLDELCSNVSSTNSTSNISQAYTPLRYSILKTLVITNPCDTDKSILIRNKIFYKYDREQHKWKRLCIAQNLFDKKIPIVNSIAHLNNDLILIINGVLFRTQNVISSVKNNDIIYRLKRYISKRNFKEIFKSRSYLDLPILFDNIDYVFTTPCCTCLKTPNYRSISHTFNDYILLANQLGNVILFNFKSVTIVYNFGNIFQFQSVCESNQCRILHLGLSHSIPSLLCFIQYETGKAVIVHQSFLNFNSTIQKSTYLNFIGDTLYIAPSTYHNSYFIWDENRLYYTTNGGLMLSEVIADGCHFDYLENMNENQLKNYYTNLNIDYDNITLITKQIYCLFNQTIDYIFISNNEFFIMTKHKKVLYGKESLAPSMINLKQEKRCSSMFQNIENQFLPGRNLNTSECLLNFNKQSLACSICLNQSCQSVKTNQLDFLLIYAIPISKHHENYARYLINRSDSCISTSQSIYRLWLKWTLNITARNQLFPIPHERRTFYRTLLNTLAISNNSCLLFNGSNPLHINDTINQASHDYLNFVLHIIAYNNKFSFGELETFVLIEIEPMYNNIYSSYRGFIFLIAVFLCTTLFMVLIHIYTYYKQQQRKKHLEYHRLHQIDAGQLHQWYDIAHYLNANENNENYVFMCNYLSNLKSTTSITKHLMEYRT